MQAGFCTRTLVLTVAFVTLSVVGLVPHEAPARGERESVPRPVDQFAGLLAASAALYASRALSYYLNTTLKAKKTTRRNFVIQALQTLALQFVNFNALDKAMHHQLFKGG